MKKKPVQFLGIILVLSLLSACATRGFSSLFGGENAGQGRSLAMQGTQTPTPFMPLAPTANGSEPLVPTGTPSPEEENLPDLPEGTAQRLNQPEGQKTVLLLGSDQRLNEGGFRTDVILLVTLNSDLNVVNVTSFPRDLYLIVPGHEDNRINTVFPVGGFELVQETFQYNFGFQPDYYALVNFESFQDLIDILGGIDVNVAYTLTDHREAYGQYTVYAGSNHMDGETTLWYARSRGTSNDLERNRRQMEVLNGIFYRVASLDGISRATELYDAYNQMVETDMPFSEMLNFLPLAANIFQTDNINTYAVSYDQVQSYTTSGGAMVLLPQPEPIREVLSQALNIQ